MFGFIVNRIGKRRKNLKRFIAGGKDSGCKNSIPRPSLYCVWIRVHEGENAALVRVWIDPGMSLFETQVTIHEPDLAAARAQAEAATAQRGSA